MVAADNPVIGQRWRGDRVEVVHRGCWVVADVAGEVVEASGDPHQLVFARSSSKSLQALAFAESGAISNFSLDQHEIALSLASHSGEDDHLAGVESILSKAGLDASALQCGAARSRFAGPDQEPSRVRHNCSGKHAGFLAASAALGVDPARYLDPDHDVQRHARAAIEAMCRVSGDELVTAVDGCGAPTFCLPLAKLATGIARVSNPHGLDDERHHACQQLTAAAAAHPAMIGGAEPEQFDTAVLSATGGRLFSKSGAEGVQVIGVRDAGIAFAGKIDDGSFRALWPLALAVLQRLGHLSPDELARLDPWIDPTIRNADGRAVGVHEVLPGRGDR